MLFCALAGCAPPAATLPLTSWKTLKAEQRVTVEVTRSDGKRERRIIRAVIAVERPDKFRLRALGPAGITLFDVVGASGRTRVLNSIRDPSGPMMATLLESIAADLATAYDLEPRPPSRKISESRNRRVITDGERTVVATPARIEIENRAHRYTVTIESFSVETDAPLDPALFADTPQ